ncbi:MAG: hypothetical protein V1849_00810, partial [Chloroflexota bacterium]
SIELRQPLRSVIATLEFELPLFGSLVLAFARPRWTVPELLFEKKQLIPAIQQLLVSCKNNRSQLMA